MAFGLDVLNRDLPEQEPEGSDTGVDLSSVDAARDFSTQHGRN